MAKEFMEYPKPKRKAPGLFEPKDPAQCTFKFIKYDKKDGIARVTINRPEVYNSYNLQTIMEMTQAFDDVTVDDRIGCVILRGEGDVAFCTGGDVKEYAESIVQGKSQDMWGWMNQFVRAHDALRNCGKTTIAALNGIVVGGGNEWNLSCDVAIMADAEFIEKKGKKIPTRYIKQVGATVGSVAAGGATQYLPLVVGLRRAKEILLFNRPILPQHCKEWGLVNEVVPYNELDDVVDKWAHDALNQFPGSIRSTREQLNFLGNFVWGSTMGFAKDTLTRNMGGIESYFGMVGFAHKRPVNYDSIRQAMAAGADGESLFGPYTHTCPSCGKEGMPLEFDWCGACGAELKAK
ncbi:MAG: enoyl-CoA hydratase/isomerase family protein [Candidatus Latescibacterota bacterium]